MIINVINVAGGVQVRCPYSKAFVDFAHMRGAKFSDGTKAWLFDLRDEFAVRSVLVEIYGTDDYAKCEKVDVRVSLDHFDVRYIASWFFLGRTIAARPYRDSPVRLGEGVAIIAGNFPSSGGSRNNPALQPRPGTVLEVRGVPMAMAEATRRQHPEAIEILGQYDLVKLRQEREFLLRRVAEIDQILARQDKEDEEILADLQDSDDDPPESGSGEAVAG